MTFWAVNEQRLSSGRGVAMIVALLFSLITGAPVQAQADQTGRGTGYEELAPSKTPFIQSGSSSVKRTAQPNRLPMVLLGTSAACSLVTFYPRDLFERNTATLPVRDVLVPYLARAPPAA